MTAPESRRTLPPLAFAGVAVASFGGPLALAAQGAPGIAAGASGSSGFTALAGALLFLAPLTVWLRYSRQVRSSGGLFAFVEAAAGRRVALAQAAIWTLSYLLYLVYTTVQIVYDLLPAVLPGERRYQSLLALAIPVGIAGLLLAGRGVTLVALGGLAAGQVLLAGVLDGVTVAHLSTPSSSFRPAGSSLSLLKVGAQSSQLYVCGSLPLFLGGELAGGTRALRRGLIAAFLLTAALVAVAVAPLAAVPGLMSTQLPGVSLAAQFASSGVTHAIGIGVAASTAGVMVCEYLALTRLAHAVAGWPVRSAALVIGAITVLAAPFVLIDPEGIYNALLTPSLVALWASQLIVFAAYPRFARRFRQSGRAAWVLAAVSSAMAVYGIWTALQQSTT